MDTGVSDTAPLKVEAMCSDLPGPHPQSRATAAWQHQPGSLKRMELDKSRASIWDSSSTSVVLLWEMWLKAMNLLSRLLTAPIWFSL